MFEKIVDGLILCLLPILGTTLLLSGLMDDRGLLYSVNFGFVLVGVVTILYNAYLIGTLVNEKPNVNEVE